jgi:RNA polymerase sigma-70 factor, ECF subfamily
MNGSSLSTTRRIDRDGSLVAALRRSDPTAAEDLVAAYGDRACRLATRITRNAQDAEEAVQDAFLSVIRKIDTFRGESTFGSWLYRIVANAACQRCRRRRGRGADVSLDKLLPAFDEHGRHVAPVADWSMSLDDPARQTELRLVLSTAIDELPAHYRAVVLLRDVEQLSLKDIAATLGLTVVNVKTRVHRARLFLRKRLDAHLSGQRSKSLARICSTPVVGLDGREAAKGGPDNGRAAGRLENVTPRQVHDAVVMAADDTPLQKGQSHPDDGLDSIMSATVVESHAISMARSLEVGEVRCRDRSGDEVAYA